MNWILLLLFNDKKSQTMEQLKLSSGLSEEEINKKVKDLAGKEALSLISPTARDLWFLDYCRC